MQDTFMKTFTSKLFLSLGNILEINIANITVLLI